MALEGFGEAAAMGAGKAVGIVGGAGLGLWAVLRFVQWLAEFLVGRLDRRSADLDRREKALEQRYDARLRHLEEELERYREATMVLVNALAVESPTNRALQQVARLLKQAAPIASPDKDLDELLQQAAAAVEKKGARA